MITEATLFDSKSHTKQIYISPSEAATMIGVSTATIHNWIKTGYLLAHEKKVNLASVEDFICHTAGIEKLNTRANKQKKSPNNYEEISHSVEKWLATSTTDIEKLYEKALSESFRNKEGIYYTPETIVEDMMRNVPITENTTFLDPCCGGGNFIMAAIKRGIKPENIFGFDTDRNAVAITRKRIFEATGYDSKQIVQEDFLKKADKLEKRFDWIFTNPPWGKKMPKTEKNKYATIYQSGNSNDTCSLFLCASLQLLKEDGWMGFLMPEAFFNITTFEDSRKKILNYKILRLTDYKKPFKGLMTRAQSVILQNTQATDDTIYCQYEGKHFFRTIASFRKTPKTILNFQTDGQAAEIISHIYNKEHSTLSKNTKWGLGIVTGNNKKWCKPTPENETVPVYRGQDISPNNLKEPSLFIPKDMSSFQQVAPLPLYQAKEKLIYRFISSKLVFFCDTKQRYILNSANMLILEDNFPLSGQQLTDLLNSRFMNWMFENIFHTHKVLQSDLEALPIFAEYFQTHPVFHEKSYLAYLNIEEENGTYRIKK